MKFKAILSVLAVILAMTVFSMPASTKVSRDNDKDVSVNDSVESKTPLTPSGNMTTVDDVHQVNNKDTVEDKQFITVETKNGNTFYIIIDRSGDTENVYFLNAVDESDLLALMEDEQKAEVTAVCTCSTKCELGSVNADCAVCTKNMNSCIGAAAATPEPEDKSVEKSKNAANPIVILLVFALLGGGGALYWFKLRNKQSSTKGSTDLNDLYEEDEDYETEEETEIETNSGDAEDKNIDDNDYLIDESEE